MAPLRGIEHPRWKGEQVSYGVLHKWVQQQLGKPNICTNCGSIKAKRYEWSNISGEYHRDINDWQRMCAACHKIYDNAYDHARQPKSPEHIEKLVIGSPRFQQTHCVNGHEFNDTNTRYKNPNKDYPRGRRICLPCLAVSSHKSYLRKKANGFSGHIWYEDNKERLTKYRKEYRARKKLDGDKLP